jgi:hypothetical protein
MKIPQVAKAMQKVLNEKANELAWETGFVKREREISGSSFVKGLVFGWIAEPNASLAALSQSIANAGSPISRQALHERFCAKSSQFLKAVLAASLETSIAAMPVPDSLLKRFTAVDLVDSSVISLPNDLASVWQAAGGNGKSNQAALKISLRFDLCCGRLSHLDLSAARVHDSQAPAHQDPVLEGSLRIEDLGYFSLDFFAKLEQENAYWLSRYKQGTWLYDEQGHELDLAQVLPQKINAVLDCSVLLGQSKRLPCRLVAQRVPLAVAQQRRERLRETARRCQKAISSSAWALADWTIYLTNLPADLVASQEVFILGRYRWQIELLFKLWKSDLGIDKWQSKEPERILSELYCKLLGAIISHWLLLVACWHNPRRSLRQAMPSIRALAWQFANSLNSLSRLAFAFTTLIQALSKCRMDKSQQRPCTFQLLAASIA